METKTTKLQMWAAPAPCGCLSCDSCYPSDADVLEALGSPVAPTAHPAPQSPATGRAVRMAAVPVPTLEAVFGGR
jgi:hypothetical protein